MNKKFGKETKEKSVMLNPRLLITTVLIILVYSFQIFKILYLETICNHSVYNAFVVIKTLSILIANKDSCVPPAGAIIQVACQTGRQGWILGCVENT